MGQTLTHGIYLPDEGERNCYNGLAANWSILDGAVGTIAEHTSALSGKAPLVHTHVKSDVTDFPAYGNAAGTICEGNDSRLSDARTPVAHTHSKSDITNLFNSANTWSNINTYQREIQLAGDRNAHIAPMWAGAGSGIAFLSMDASKQFVFGQRTTDANNRSCYDATKGFLTIKAGETGGDTIVSVIPFGSDTKLGDSTNKWKTLNGINPGALSLPASKSDPISTQNWVKRPSSSDGGFICNIVPSVNCWICIQVSREKDFGVWVIGTFRQSFRAVQTNPTTYVNMLFFPALAGSNINIYTNSVETGDADLTFNIARIYPCLGNV